MTHFFGCGAGVGATFGLGVNVGPPVKGGGVDGQTSHAGFWQQVF